MTILLARTVQGNVQSAPSAGRCRTEWRFRQAVTQHKSPAQGKSHITTATGVERNGREFSAGEAETDDGVSRSHRLPPPRLPLRARSRADRRRRTRRQQAPYEGQAVDELAPRPLLPHCESTPSPVPSQSRLARFYEARSIPETIPALRLRARRTRTAACGRVLVGAPSLTPATGPRL